MALALQREQTAYRSLLMVSGAVQADPHVYVCVRYVGNLNPPDHAKAACTARTPNRPPLQAHKGCGSTPVGLMPLRLIENRPVLLERYA